jgi:RHS repeat-associated protein
MVYGPDLSGAYGGAQGIGGLEATISENTGTLTAVLSDSFANGVATVSKSGSTFSVKWSDVKVNSYGPMPGHRALTLESGAPVAETFVWRGRRIDETGLFYLGARYYEPTSGRFISPDPLGHLGSMDLYSYANGDPINYFDADGRLAKRTVERVTGIDLERPLGPQLWEYHQGFGEGARQGAYNEIVGVAKFAKGATFDLGQQISYTAFDAYGAYFGGDDYQFESAIFSGLYNMAAEGHSDLEIAGEAALQVSGYRFGNQIYDSLEHGLETGDYSEFSQNMGTFAAVSLSSARAPETSVTESGALFRRTSNMGEFSGLEVNMSKQAVLRYAEQGGVGLEGVKISINRQPELMGSGLFGSAGRGNRITLYPDAFSSPEMLMRTLAHERTHLMQYDIYGINNVKGALRNGMEKAAYGIEDSFVDYSRMGGSR